MAYVTFTRHLQRFFPNLGDGEIPGATVRDVVDELERRHPGFRSFVVDETGRLRKHVNVFVGEEPIADRETLGDAIAPDAKLYILQALSGG